LKLKYDEPFSNCASILSCAPASEVLAERAAAELEAGGGGAEEAGAGKDEEEEVRPGG